MVVVIDLGDRSLGRWVGGFEIILSVLIYGRSLLDSVGIVNGK